MATAKSAASRKRAALPDPLAPPAVQPELTDVAAAAGATPANDEARKSIAIIQTALAEVDVIEAGIATLETKYAKVVYDCAVPAQMEQCKDALRDIQTPRFALENARVAAKRPLLDMGRQIDGRAAALKARFMVIETPLVDMKTKAENAERERKADIEKRIAELRGTATQCIGKKAEQLQEVLDALDTIDLATFAEFREQAAKAQFDAQQQVRQLLATAKQAEELEELRNKQKLEDARKAAIQRQIDDMGAPLQQLPMCRTSARVDALIDKVETWVVDEAVYQEFSATAREKKASVLAALVASRDEKKRQEDARAEAQAKPVGDLTAAPAPGPAPAMSPAAAPASGWGLSSRAATRLAAEVEDVLEKDLVGGKDPHGFTAGDMQDAILTRPGESLVGRVSQERSIERETSRPTDAELLGVLAAHYEVPTPVAAAWLRSMDIDAALSQLQLGV